MAETLSLEEVNRRLRGAQAPAPAPAPAATRPSAPARLSLDDVNAMLRRGADDTIDMRTGAPLSVRAAVGAAPPEGRLETLQRTFPGAEPAIGDPDNFVFRDPATGRLTLYNPPGLDIGDIASLGVEAGQFVGGAVGAGVGGLAGSAVSPGPGTVVGAMGGAGAGTAIGGEAVRSGMEAFGLLEDPRTPGERGLDLATEFGLGALGEGAGMLAGAGLREGVRRLVRGGAAGRREMGAALDEFASFDAAPSVGQATRRRVFDAAEAYMARIPGGAGQISRQVRDTVEKARKRIESLSANLSGAAERLPDEEILGRAVKGDIEKRFLPRWRAKKNALFDKASALVAPDAQAAPNETLSALADLAGADPRAPLTSRSGLARSPSLARLNEAIGGDLLGAVLRGESATLPLAVLDRLRRRVGDKLGSTDLVVSADRGELKRLYAALSNDYENALLAADPSGDALRAYQRANKFYQAGLQRIDTFLEPIARKDTARDAFAAIERADGERLRAIRRSVEPEHWRAVAAAVLRRMGGAAPAERPAGGLGFDLEKFLSRWNDMDPRAKAALFEGHPEMGTLRRDLDKIAAAARRVRENQEAFAAARTGTGAAAGITLGLVGLGSAALGQLWLLEALAAGAGIAAGAGKLMTSPRFVRWLAKATDLRPNGLGAHIGRLGAIAASEPDPEARDAMLGVLETLGDSSEAVGTEGVGARP